MNLILTCEHAGNEIPQDFISLFPGAEEVLESHRGYDPGAFDLFKVLNNLAELSHFQMVSRLLVEMNRSLDHPQLFSEFSRGLDSAVKKEILEIYYFPYRNSVEKEISERIGKGEEVLHFSVHTFTPNLNGEKREADIGLLFDPTCTSEEEFCSAFKNELFERNSGLQIKFNYPYRGIDDGFTTYLRQKFTKDYCGIELEVNQRFVSENKMNKGLKNNIFEALSTISKSF